MSNPFSSVEKKVSDAISAAEKSLTDNLDFTKVIVFIRSVTVEVSNYDLIELFPPLFIINLFKKTGGEKCRFFLQK